MLGTTIDGLLCGVQKKNKNMQTKNTKTLCSIKKMK